MPGKPELLAPAGDWDSLVAAVENGADAVYLGGKLFNARQSAANFNNEEIARAVEFAHVRGVKVYVAVNILLDDKELPDAVRFLYFLHRCGADAAIIQDLGLLRLARKVIPEMPLHASTQMTVHNLPSAVFLKEAGIARVVLARELSIEAIKRIVDQSGIEVEVFVHGALCICYSGQCLMSSLIGGRSGNRGRCAQPCRLQYALVDRNGRPLAEPQEVGEYLLSPRDLNMSGHLPDLIEAGVASFKIEGRMKRPEYVATVVRVYRELLDRAASGETFKVKPEEARELAQIFNRDFTTGYFYGRPGRDLMSFKRPNNRGVRLGRVKGFDRKTGLVQIFLEEPLRVGDGMEVWVSVGGRVAGEVSRIVLEGRNVDRAAAGSLVELDLPGRVFPGDRVFKTYDADLMERAKKSFTSPKEQKKIPLNFYVQCRRGEHLTIRVEDPEGFTGRAESDSTAREAINRPLTYEYLEKQLSRLGNTPFEMAQLKCRLEGELMVPVREINEARRKALAELEERRAAFYRREPVSEDVFNRRFSDALSRKTEGAVHGRPSLSVTVTDLSSLLAAVKAGAGEVYFGGERYRSKGHVTLEDIFAGIDACAEAGVRFILSSPRILQDQDMDWFSRLAEKVAKRNLDGVQAGNPGLIKKAGEITGRPVFADFPLNVFNSEAAAFLAEAGAGRVTLSPELTLKQVRSLVPFLPVPAEVIVHGALPLMISEYCPVGSLLGSGRPEGCSSPCGSRRCALKDRKGFVFPLEQDQFCRIHIFNSRDLCVIDDIGSLAEAGVSVLRIEARNAGPDYVREVVRAYRTVLDMLPEMPGEKEVSVLKDSMSRYSPQGFTKGHFYRGVL